MQKEKSGKIHFMRAREHAGEGVFLLHFSSPHTPFNYTTKQPQHILHTISSITFFNHFHSSKKPSTPLKPCINYTTTPTPHLQQLVSVSGRRSPYKCLLRFSSWLISRYCFCIFHYLFLFSVCCIWQWEYVDVLIIICFDI